MAAAAASPETVIALDVTDEFNAALPTLVKLKESGVVSKEAVRALKSAETPPMVKLATVAVLVVVVVVSLIVTL